MNSIRINKGFCSFLLLLSLIIVGACRKGKDNQPEDQSCIPVTPVGRMNASISGDTYTYRTAGGGNIKIELNSSISLRRILITDDSYPGFNLELWGDTTVNGTKTTSANHENLNGKHIKDRLGARRSIIFPDGAKITLIADGAKGPLLYISVYDGGESHRINLSCNTLIKSSTDTNIARQLDNEEADGETGGFELTPTGLIFFNIYTEDNSGSKTGTRLNIGEIFRDRPNQVNDYYDDSRLAAT